MCKFKLSIFLFLALILVLPSSSFAAIKNFKYVTIDVPSDYLASEEDNTIIISKADTGEQGFSLSMELAEGDFELLVSSLEEIYDAKAEKDDENSYTMEFVNDGDEYSLMVLNHGGFFSVFVLWGADEELLNIIATVDYK